MPYEYIPKILPLTAAEAAALIDQRNYELWALGRSFNGPELWDLTATLAVRQAEESAERAEE